MPLATCRPTRSWPSGRSTRAARSCAPGRSASSRPASRTDELHGKARYLIADDVGLGKTLSMAAAALVLSLLDDKPVLILAPATLIWQWQEELEDKLGIPAAVWSTQKKCWLDGERRPLTQKGDPDAGGEMPLADRDHVDRPDRQRRRRGRAGRSGEEVVRRRDPRRGSQGPRIRAACRGAMPPKPNNLLVFLRTVARNADERDPRHRHADPARCRGAVGPAGRPRPRRTAGARDAIRWRRVDAGGVDPVSDRRAALAAERYQPLGAVPQPAAARRRAFRVSRHPQRCEA